jgi:endogenous inhibitor of DNA gyrase (YacG/DUF329 family)
MDMPGPIPCPSCGSTSSYDAGPIYFCQECKFNSAIAFDEWLARVLALLEKAARRVN